MILSRAETPLGHVLRSVGRGGIPEISLARLEFQEICFLFCFSLAKILRVGISSYQATGSFLVLEHRERNITVQRRNIKDSMSFKCFSDISVNGIIPQKPAPSHWMLSYLIALPLVIYQRDKNTQNFKMWFNCILILLINLCFWDIIVF